MSDNQNAVLDSMIRREQATITRQERALAESKARLEQLLIVKERQNRPQAVK